jgi:hypothetical protein
LSLAVHVPDPDFRIFRTLLKAIAYFEIFDYRPWSAILPPGNSRQSARDFRHSFFHMFHHLGIREDDVIEQIHLTLRCMNTQVSKVIASGQHNPMHAGNIEYQTTCPDYHQS